MGYEIRLHIGTLCKIGVAENFFSEVAVIHLSKSGSTQFLKLKEKGNDIQKELRRCKIYIEPNTKTEVDMYGEPLQAIDATLFLESLKEDCEASKKEYGGELPYRRFSIAIAFLEEFVERFKNENPVVVMYGY